MQQQWAPFIKTAPHEVTYGVGRLGHLVVSQCVELAVCRGQQNASYGTILTKRDETSW